MQALTHIALQELARVMRERTASTALCHALAMDHIHILFLKVYKRGPRLISSRGPRLPESTERRPDIPQTVSERDATECSEDAVQQPTTWLSTVPSDRIGGRAAEREVIIRYGFILSSL